MKVLLLNDGGYEGLEGLEFPVVVGAECCAVGFISVRKSLLSGGMGGYIFKICDAEIINEALTSVRTPSGLRSANVGYTVSGKEISVHTIESVGGTNLIDQVDGASMLLLKISLAAIEESK